MAASTGADIIQAVQAGTLAGLMLERVRRSSERTAYLYCDPDSNRWIELSWRQVGENAGIWQQALLREGLRPGDRVSLQMSNRPEWVYFDMAASGLGLVTVPLFSNDRPESIRYILDDAGVRLLLVETAEQLSALAPIIPRLENLKRVLVLDPRGADRPETTCTGVEDWLMGARGGLTDSVDDPERLATIVYTSGTMGPPKGVMLSHCNILWNAEASLECIQAFPDDRFLSFLPLSHTLERTGGYYLPMMAGASVAYARSIPLLAEDLESIRPTVLIAVPRIFERIHAKIQAKLLDKPKVARMLLATAVTVGWHRFECSQGRRPWSADLLFAPLLDRFVARPIRRRLGGRLRIAVSGGAPISLQVARFFIGLGIPLVQGYGLTEASPVVSVSPLEDNLPDSVGPPLQEVETHIGAEDELLVKSPGVMQGYWQRPEATAEVLSPDGWLRTGDQVRTNGRHLFIIGRLKEIIVLSNGKKIAPADLEMAIAMDTLFSQVLILGEGRPFLTGLTVLETEAYRRLAAKEGLGLDLQTERGSPRLEGILVERIGKLLTAFPGYAKVPRVAVTDEPWSTDNGLLTPTLKLKRECILKRYRHDVARLYEGH